MHAIIGNLLLIKRHIGIMMGLWCRRRSISLAGGVGGRGGLVTLAALTCAPECYSITFHMGYPPTQCMRRSNSNRASQSSFSHGSAPQGLAFRVTCIECNGNFGTRVAAECHSRNRQSQGTPCADARNIKSNSITSRPDLPTGKLRQHDAGPIGEWCIFSCTLAFRVCMTRMIPENK